MDPGREVRYGIDGANGPVGATGSEPTLWEREAVKALYMMGRTKRPAQHRSGTTIGSKIPRVAGKGSNNDLSKHGR